MIIKAEIISQPYSGQYRELVYDIQDSWKSSYWTWVKFEDENFDEWCGEFRGLSRQVAISEKYSVILVLTSDYLFQLDIHSGELIEYEARPQYMNLTVTPQGDFILADYYNIDLMQSSIRHTKSIESPIKMDMIKFSGWQGMRLTISCDEFLNWSNHVELELDSETLEITVKSEKNKV